jgi:uncharacterized repeat protein (TIGR01451 family)
MQASLFNLCLRLRAACILFLALVCAPVLAVTSAGTTITNTAELRYRVDGAQVSLQGVHQASTSLNTAAAVSILHFVAPEVPGAQAINFPASQCWRANTVSVSPTPRLLYAPRFTGNGTAHVLSGPMFKGGDTLAFRVIDYDQNRNDQVAETLEVVVSSGQDSERVVLTETGLSTGVFTAYLQTTRQPSSVRDCELTVQNNDQVIAKYVDVVDSSVTIASVTVDPLGRVFDAITGQLINGARVTLIDVRTGLPAEVYNDDGTTRYPSTVTTGVAVRDAAGNLSQLADGQYRFPLVAIGNYRLTVVPPDGYRFPSSLSPQSSAALKDTTWRLGNGSRGEPFGVVLGPPVEIDVPLDPRAGKIEVVKTANRDKAGVGETVLYTVEIKNSDNAAVLGLGVIDDIPPGMRYRPGSARLAANAQGDAVVVADPFVGNGGQRLRFDWNATLAPRASMRLTYALQVTAATPMGKQTNVAYAAYSGGVSNQAYASLLIVDELLTTTAILLGRVSSNCEPSKGQGLPGIRIQLEDGRFAVTDSQGAWHLEAVRAGGHVVQIDRHSLPKGASLIDCRDTGRELSTHELRMAQIQGSGPNARIVNLRAGGMERVDFAVKLAVNTNPSAPPTALAITQIKADTAAPEPDSAFWAGATSQADIVFPPAQFSPQLAAVGVSVKHSKLQRAELFINDSAVTGFSFEGTKSQGDVSLTFWRAVPLREGLNKLSAKVFGAGNVLLHTIEREVVLPGVPSTAVLLPEQSVLVADGNRPIRVKVKMLDAAGNPARRGLSGPYEVRGNYLPAQQVGDQLRDPISGNAAAAQQFTIGAQGMVELVMQPSSQSGDLVLRFPTFETAANREVKVWVNSAPRDWIVVGFAEGSWMESRLKTAIKSVSGAPGMDVDVDGGRVALYARGSIPGDFLVTAAYDTRGKQQTPDRNLAQALKPDEHYLVYGDEASVQRDAVSSRKLYLRIERQQFYAMFGDFAARLVANELMRHDRVLNGVKTQATTKLGAAEVSATAFASKTGQRAVRDELTFDGTSGAYRLSQKSIEAGSERIRIQVRSRFPENELIAERALQRFVDYRIDYPTGEVVLAGFARPTSWGGNRVLLIVDYETAPGARQDWVAGGRVSAKVPDTPIGTIEVGATAVHDGTAGRRGQVAGVDATLQVNPQHKVRVEVATSKGEVLEPTTGVTQHTKGNAVSAEYTYKTPVTDARVFHKQTDQDYGIKSQTGAEQGITRSGLQVRQKLSGESSAALDVQRSETPLSETTTLEARFEQQYGRAGWYTGARAQKTESATVDDTALQAVGGVNWKSQDQRLGLRAESALSVMNSASTVVPNRLLLGAEYALTRSVSLLAEQVWLNTANDHAHLTRAGFKLSPEWGGEYSLTAGSAASSSSAINAADARALMALGYQQRWALSPQWSFNAALQRQNWIGSDALLQTSNASPGASAVALDKYTASVLSAQYTKERWSMATTWESRWGDVLTRHSFGTSVFRKHAEGVALAGSINVRDVTEAANHSREVLGRLAFALREPGSAWNVLQRIDLSSTATTNAGGSVNDAQKLLSNLHVNYKPSHGTQFSLHHGLKYLRETVQGTAYQGLTNFLMMQARHDLSRNFDVGAHLFGAYNHQAHLATFGYGVDLGVSLGSHVRFSLGYNLRGLQDGVYNEASWTRPGSYVRVQMRFDEDSFRAGSDTTLVK